MTSRTPLATGRRAPGGRASIRLLAAGLLLAGAAAVGSRAALTFLAMAPDVEHLEEYRASTITRVTGAGGETLAVFAAEHRIPLSYDQIPERLRQAVVAVEDAEFFSHHGVNLRGVLRAALRNAVHRRLAEGGSSLTQQLAKVLFLSPERTLRRKLAETTLALNLERSYSKQEILTLYANEVYLGHGRYGMEAASRYYFGTGVGELDLARTALLAGLPQRPEGYSPYRDPEAALRRRNHVLDRMVATGAIDAGGAAAAKARPLGVLPRPRDEGELASYFVEEVRKEAEGRFGSAAVHREGLTIETTLDTRLQRAAEAAVRAGLLALDHRHGWRDGALHNVLRDGPARDLAAYRHPDWNRPLARGELVHGLVVAREGRAVRVRAGARAAFVARVAEAPAWTGRRDPASLYAVGDVGLFRVVAAGPSGLSLAIEQEPEAEAALVAIDVRTGAVRALVGGWDFERSRFDRATQALRQPGSAFKPIVYAAALERGLSPADTRLDGPLDLRDPATGAAYSPGNHDGRYQGLITLREALERSRNPVAVKLLLEVGPAAVIDAARRLGIGSRLEPYPSLALGSFETSLLELTSAYAALANLGTYRTPYLIERVVDRDGRQLELAPRASRRAIKPEVAHVMTRLLEGVIERGTGRRARGLGRPLGGKTGTTDGYGDAWFIGYSPGLACGVWVGKDRVEDSLGAGEEGARAALPIWVDFMQAALEGTAPEGFPEPPGVEHAWIDPGTGRLAGEACAERIEETFVRGTAPGEPCGARDHELRALPWYLQEDLLDEGSEAPLDAVPRPEPGGSLALSLPPAGPR